MDKNVLMRRLASQPASTWMALLGAAYDTMNQRQREAVFGTYTTPARQAAHPDARKLLLRIKRFHRESLAGKFYASFNVNSKNWMHIPKETEDWFGQLGQYLTESANLTKQGRHTEAEACFSLLYELIGAIEAGDEIVFADELGSWMIPVNEKKVIGAYLKSLAATASPERYTAVTLPLVKRDAQNSFSDKVWASALRAAKADQKALLLAEVERQHIETAPVARPRRALAEKSSNPSRRNSGRH